MAPSRSSGPDASRCVICEREVPIARSAGAERPASCPHCGNQPEFADGRPAAIRLAAYPILDQQTMDVFDRISDMLMHTKPPLVDLDFQGVSFLTSAALSKLVKLVRMAQGEKTRVTLHNVEPHIREVIEITGLKRLLAQDDVD
jgi:anti-anti-sigma factor